MIRPLAAAGLIAVLTAPAAAPAAAAPSTTVVDLGGAHAYVRPDVGLPLADLTLWVRAGLDRQTGSQNGLAALVAQSVLQTPVDGRPLTDAVEALGASLSLSVTPQQARFFLEGTPEALSAAAPLVARALARPSFDPAVLAAARASLGERTAAEQDNGVAVGLRHAARVVLPRRRGLPGARQPELARGVHDGRRAGVLRALVRARQRVRRRRRQDGCGDRCREPRARRRAGARHRRRRRRSRCARSAARRNAS